MLTALLTALVWAASPLLAANSLNCLNGRSCIYMKACDGVLKEGCPLAYSFKLEGEILSMEIAGYPPSQKERYLAIGFNEENGMDNARVTECSAIGNEEIPTVKLSWNRISDENHTGNVRIENEKDFRDQIISDVLVTYQEGMLFCSWKQKVGAFNNDKVFQLVPGTRYHHIVAFGKTVDTPAKTGLMRHEGAQSVYYDTFEPDSEAPPGKGLNCEDGRTCVYMKSCKGTMTTGCPLAYSFKLEGDILNMELAGYQQAGVGRYLALGFAKKEGMGDARVTECSAIGNEKAPSVKLSYNTPGDESVNERIADEPTFRDFYISDAVGKYEDGLTYCSWKQNVSANNNDKVFSLEPGFKYHHIVAYGRTAVDGDYAGLDQHDDADSPLISDFESAEDAGDTTSTKLVKAHGSLMMIAWLISVPIAAVFARFLRSHWPTKKPFGLALWFHVHRSFNILACLVMIAGFVCIFIETNWTWRGVGSGLSDWRVTHSTVGIIACVLAWMQPFISLLRCDPQNPRRPVFNWVHRLIGMTAFLLAVTATSLAANFAGVWTEHLTYLILAFVPLGSVIVLFVIMTILDATVRITDHNLKKIHSIRFTLCIIAIGVAAAAAIALIVMLIMA